MRPRVRTRAAQRAGAPAEVKSQVRLFVRGTANALLVYPRQVGDLSNPAFLPSLQYALARGIQELFEVEESELASEVIGEGDRLGILFWEGAEGGLGVLRRLVQEPSALAAVARQALEVLHFDPATGADLRPADDPTDDDACARACYECLMSYHNQRDHRLLNRHAVRDALLALAGSVTQMGDTVRDYEAHYRWLRELTDGRSELERTVLDHLHRTGRRLPDFAQYTVPDVMTVPDFFYEPNVCVYCDGSVHDEPQQQASDEAIRRELRARGYRVIVIRYDADLEQQVRDREDVFGPAAVDVAGQAERFSHHQREWSNGMRIRHLTVARFRGIKQLDWDIAGTTVCLIGPGDSTKTTILDAIEYVLSPRWNLTVTDADFYGGNTAEPIEIVVTVAELPKALLTDEKFGLHLRGWSATDGLRDEPQDDDELALSVRLRVDESLEPTWAVVTDRNPHGLTISARDREKLGMYGSRHTLTGSFPGVEALRYRGLRATLKTWPNTCRGGRSAREVIQKAAFPKLTEAAARAAAGGSRVRRQTPLGLSPCSGCGHEQRGSRALSLHDGTVPARQAGLGSRRLLALALQRSAVREGAILLVDEVEQGLEPHRLRHLTRKLRPGSDVGADADADDGTRSGQVFMTTHSNIAVVELAADELHVVRSRMAPPRFNAFLAPCRPRSEVHLRLSWRDNYRV